MEVTVSIVMFCLLWLCKGHNGNPTETQKPDWCPRKCSCGEKDLSVTCKDLNFTEIPSDLPSFISSLDFSHNRIAKLANNTFGGFPNLTTLNLERNIIDTIGILAFKGLDNLSNLRLGQNRLSIEKLETSVFKIVHQHLPCLKELHVNHMVYPLRDTSLRPLQGTLLKHLDLSYNNGLCDLPNGVFSGLNLSVLNLMLCQCKTINVKAFCNLTLSTLMLRTNRFSTFPDFAQHNETMSFRMILKGLYLGANGIFELKKSDFIGFESLQKLNLDRNIIDKIHEGLFGHLPSLQSLILDNNRVTSIGKQAFKSTSIREIHLNNNPIYFSFDKIDVFRHAVGIEKIYLSKCIVQSLKTVESLFRNITTLEVVDLSYTKMTSIPINMFNGLRNMSRLVLEHVGITDLNAESFVDLNSLQSLDLQGNQIRVINASSFPRQVFENFTHLYLSNNPFDCSCKLFWFKDWIKDNKHKLVSYGSRRPMYNCASPSNKVGTRLEDLMLSPEECLSRPLSTSLWGVLASGSFLLFIALVTSAVYRFRWHLRLWLFYWHTWLRSSRPRRPEGNFKFDLFVSHNASDTAWVMNVLLPELEINSQPPFKLCVCGRNWLGGRNISECIVESLALSRKTLLLVTNAFARSEWCQFEMSMAEHRLIETDNDNVVVAVMEDIEPINLNPRLRLLMKRKGYLHWTDDAVGQHLFWERLKQLLRSEGESLVESMPSSEELRSVLA